MTLDNIGYLGGVYDTPCFNPLCLLNRETACVTRFIPVKCKKCEGRKLFITDERTARQVRAQHIEMRERIVSVYFQALRGSK